MRQYFVYIMASISGVLYVSVTNNIDRRIIEHKAGTRSGFTKRYRTGKLVYVEEYDDVNQAIQREKQIKKWRRSKKVQLIERMNPTWKDLALGSNRSNREQPDRWQCQMG